MDPGVGTSWHVSLKSRTKKACASESESRPPVSAGSLARADQDQRRARQPAQIKTNYGPVYTSPRPSTVTVLFELSALKVNTAPARGQICAPSPAS